MTLGLSSRLHPRVVQASVLLELSAVDLAREVEERLEGNPLLEYARAPAPVAEKPQQDSLLVHLMRQLHQMAPPRSDMRRLGESLLEQVDERGYFRGACADVAAACGVAVGDVEEVLRHMQGFEPVGVMARSLEECLRLQLKEDGSLGREMETVLDNLKALAGCSVEAFGHLCGLPEEVVQGCLERLRRCDPRPGLSFGEASVFCVPDLIVRSQEASLEVCLNEAVFPFVVLRPSYSVGGDPEARRFVSRCRREAVFLKWALERRAQTLLAVGREILARQEGFMRGQALRPLTLRQVAQAVGRHESTVSRAVSHKTMETPRGVLALRSFFCSGVPTTQGQASAQAVRERLAELVAQEAHPLSDEALARALRAEGIHIARRTVTKYRRALRVPPSHARALT